VFAASIDRTTCSRSFLSSSMMDFMAIPAISHRPGESPLPYSRWDGPGISASDGSVSNVGCTPFSTPWLKRAEMSPFFEWWSCNFKFLQRSKSALCQWYH
jgi:hypothetical protein